MGSNPRTVVKAVKSTGRNRVLAAFKIASFISSPSARQRSAATPEELASRHKRFVTYGYALLVATIFGGWMLRGGGGPTTIEQIAVLPIMDLSGSDQLFVDAVHDALISALAQTNTVGVISRSAVMPFQGSGEKTQDIARQLGVQAVVEGTVFRAGDRMRINVQMVEPTTLRHLWTQVYERDVSDVLDAQDEVVAAIAAELGAVLAGGAGDGS